MKKQFKMKSIKSKIKPLTLPKKKYFNLKNSTTYFQNLYTNYINSDFRRQKTYSDINSLLSDYRNEKLSKLPERDIIKDELGKDIQKYKSQHFFKTNRIKSLEKKDKIKTEEKQVKENRISFLYSLRQSEKKGNFIFPIHKKSKKKIELNASKILFKRRILNEEKKSLSNYFHNTRNSMKSQFTNSKTISDLNSTLQKKTFSNMKNTMNIIHKNIDFLTNEVESESSKLIKTFYKHFRSFSSDFTDWKMKQESKFPEIRKKIYDGFN